MPNINETDAKKAKMLSLVNEINTKADEFESLVLEKGSDEALTPQEAALLLRIDEIRNNLSACKIALRGAEKAAMQSNSAETASDTTLRTERTPMEGITVPIQSEEQPATEPMNEVYAVPDYLAEEPEFDFVPEMPVAPTYAAPQFSTPAGAFAPVACVYAAPDLSENTGESEKVEE